MPAAHFLALGWSCISLPPCTGGELQCFQFPDNSTCQHTGWRIVVPGSGSESGGIWARLPWKSTEKPLTPESCIPDICRFYLNSRHLFSLFSILLNARGHQSAFYFQSRIPTWKLVWFFSAQFPPEHLFCSFYSI